MTDPRRTAETTLAATAERETTPQGEIVSADAEAAGALVHAHGVDAGEIAADESDLFAEILATADDAPGAALDTLAALGQAFDADSSEA